MNKFKLILNSSTSLLLKIITIICGLVLPQLLLRTFGSATNGMISSIGQFLSVISFLELGVGSVMESALYYPLATHDPEQINRIITSAHIFFKRLAYIFVTYVLVLAAVYPKISSGSFDPYFTVSLILVLSIKSFAENYFGIVDGLLLSADQRGYISDILRIAAILLNTFLSVILIHMNYSIHVVKLAAALTSMIVPLGKRQYVTRHYKIDRHVRYDREPIAQKWNGVAQHVAAIVLDSTDSIVLTFFSTLENVSVYSVYSLVIMGIRQLACSVMNSIQAPLGELWAKQERGTLKKTFGWIEWGIHTGVTLIFGCTAVLITPFVLVYTYGITDANYVQPLFGVLLTLAYTTYCLKYPYILMVYAAGHYKQTQKSYITAALINIVFSIMAVWYYGLIGVAVGTLISMAYHLLWMARYSSRNLLNWPLRNVLKQLLADILIFSVAAFVSGYFKMGEVSYISWIALAVKVAAVWLMVSLVVNSLLYKEKVLFLFSSIKGKLR